MMNDMGNKKIVKKIYVTGSELRTKEVKNEQKI